MTPPYFLCIFTCDETTLLSILNFGAFKDPDALIIEAQVSSQEVSIPRIIIFPCYIEAFLIFWEEQKQALRYKKQFASWRTRQITIFNNQSGFEILKIDYWSLSVFCILVIGYLRYMAPSSNG